MLHFFHLGPDATDLARAVAVLERTELDHAARLAGLAPLDGARAAELLIRAGVLRGTRFVLSTPSCVAASTGTWRWPSGPNAPARRPTAWRRQRRPGPGRRTPVGHHPAGDSWTVEQLRIAGPGGHGSVRRNPQPHTCDGP